MSRLALISPIISENISGFDGAACGSGPCCTGIISRNCRCGNKRSQRRFLDNNDFAAVLWEKVGAYTAALQSGEMKLSAEEVLAPMKG